MLPLLHIAAQEYRTSRDYPPTQFAEPLEPASHKALRTQMIMRLGSDIKFCPPP